MQSITFIVEVSEASSPAAIGEAAAAASIGSERIVKAVDVRSESPALNWDLLQAA